MPAEGAPALAECKPGDAHQEWWMPSARAADRVYGNLRSRATKEVVRLRGDGKQENAPAQRAAAGNTPAAQFRVVPATVAPAASPGAAGSPAPNTPAPESSALPEDLGAPEVTPEEESDTEPDATPAPGEDAGE